MTKRNIRYTCVGSLSCVRYLFTGCLTKFSSFNTDNHTILGKDYGSCFIDKDTVSVKFQVWLLLKKKKKDSE